MVGRSFLLVLKLLLSGSLHAESASGPRVVFLSPDDSRFWLMVSGFMEAVADDLDVPLEVEFDRKRHRFSYLELAEQVFSRSELPDYLLIMCKEGVTTQILRRADALGIRVFTFNTDIPPATRDAVGLPRETLPNWIGHMSPDNRGAGQTLARLLAQSAGGAQTPAAEAPTLEPAEYDEPLPMIGLSGTRDSSAAVDRDFGLAEVAASGEVNLLQLVRANWLEAEADEKVGVLLARYPQAAAIWSASDGMALGALAAAERAGRIPGQDVMVGGIDWESRALTAIREGRMAVSLGRHFMGGGLALMLVHDYHHGHDFAGESWPVLSYPLMPATRDNVDDVERIMDRDNWQALDFRQFSAVWQNGVDRPAEGAAAMMDSFSSALAELP